MALEKLCGGVELLVADCNGRYWTDHNLPCGVLEYNRDANRLRVGARVTGTHRPSLVPRPRAPPRERVGSGLWGRD